LNELEVVKGEVFANVWQTNTSPASKDRPCDRLDRLEGTPHATRSTEADVLNGIAYGASGRLFVTGKLWPKLFEIKFSSY
jgi:glutamine cyclotransferase